MVRAVRKTHPIQPLAHREKGNVQRQRHDFTDGHINNPVSYLAIPIIRGVRRGMG